MLNAIIELYPEGCVPLSLLLAFLVSPLRKATQEKSLRQPGNPGSTVCTALLVTCQQAPRLLQLLEEIAVEIFRAAGVREAQQQLRQPIPYDLLLVDADLPDGSWQDLLPFVSDYESPCEMIVCSRLGDERLWVEVMEQGAFDLLAEPYEEREVLRIIQGALDSQSVRRSSRRQAA